MFLVWVRKVFRDTISLLGNFRAAQFGSEKPKHFQFTLAQWLNHFGFQILDFGFWIGRRLWKSSQELST